MAPVLTQVVTTSLRPDEAQPKVSKIDIQCRPLCWHCVILTGTYCFLTGDNDEHVWPTWTYDSFWKVQTIKNHPYHGIRLVLLREFRLLVVKFQVGNLGRVQWVAAPTSIANMIFFGDEPENSRIPYIVDGFAGVWHEAADCLFMVCFLTAMTWSFPWRVLLKFNSGHRWCLHMQFIAADKRLWFYMQCLEYLHTHMCVLFHFF